MKSQVNVCEMRGFFWREFAKSREHGGVRTMWWPLHVRAHSAEMITVELDLKSLRRRREKRVGDGLRHVKSLGH